MAKASPLDRVDRKILEILQENSRASVAEIARAVGYSESAVRYRLNRLVKQGIITKFTALLNPKAVGYPVAAIVLIKAEGRYVEKVFQELDKIDEVFHILQVTGTYDLVSVIHATEMKHLNAIVARIRSIKGVGEANVWLATGLLKIRPFFKLS